MTVFPNTTNPDSFGTAREQQDGKGQGQHHGGQQQGVPGSGSIIQQVRKIMSCCPSQRLDHTSLHLSH